MKNKEQFYPTVRLHPQRKTSVLRYHHWIFSGAISSVDISPQYGDLVRVCDEKGNFLAMGSWERGAIKVRIFSFFEPIENLEEWFLFRLREAWKLRCAMFLLREPNHPLQRNNIFRLVYGESDGLSGLIIDVYGKVAVIQAHSEGMYKNIDLIKNILIENKLEGLRIDAVYDKSFATLPGDAEVVENQFLCGTMEEQDCYENGIRFEIDLKKGQKTGFFIDQRENRSLVEKYASERRVLNMFSYTGGFSLYALRGGAVQVDSLDSSHRALDMAQKAVENNFSPAVVQRHNIIDKDAFEYLRSLRGNEYDLMILDPPAFAKHRKDVKNACAGYRKLNALALQKIAKGSFLFTFSCSQLVTPHDFKMAVLTAAIEVQRNVKIIRYLSQSEDHPVSLFHPEGEYLKGLLLYVE